MLTQGAPAGGAEQTTTGRAAQPGAYVQRIPGPSTVLCFDFATKPREMVTVWWSARATFGVCQQCRPQCCNFPFPTLINTMPGAVLGSSCVSSGAAAVCTRGLMELGAWKAPQLALASEAGSPDAMGRAESRRALSTRCVLELLPPLSPARRCQGAKNIFVTPFAGCQEMNPL